MIADHRRNLGRVGKIETLPILQICPRPSQTIGDIYDFEFSLVGKIWDSRERVESPIVWDFPDIWKPGLRTVFQILLRISQSNGKNRYLSVEIRFGISRSIANPKSGF